MLAACDSFCAILASLAVSNASTSVRHVRFSLSWASTRAKYSWLKSLTKSTKLSVPTAFRFRPVEPGVSSPGVAVEGVSDAAVVLAIGVCAPTTDGARDAGLEWPPCLGNGGEGRSESTTSDARPKMLRLPTKPSISSYMASLNSKDIFLVFDNIFFSSLLIPHQLVEPVPSMYSLSFL